MSKKRLIDEIVLSSDDEDDSDADLKAALKLSKAEHDLSQTKKLKPSLSEPESSKSDGKKKALDQGAPAGGREEMERARLARQRAREEQQATSGVITKPAYTVRPAPRPTNVNIISDVTASSTSTATATVAFSSSSSVHGFSSLSSSTPTPTPTPTPVSNLTRMAERFWDGALRRNFNLHYPNSQSFNFDQVLGPKNDLLSAVISAFVMDKDWVLEHFRDTSHPLMLVTATGCKSGTVGVLDPTVRKDTFVVVPKEKSLYQGGGCMHTKLFVLVYPKFLRIVIPSANSVDYDWDRIENALYIQDFPRLPSPSDIPSSNPTNTPFIDSLLSYVGDLGCRPRFLAPFSNYDFSASKNVRLVVSRQGWWDDWDEIEKGGGICDLAKAVKELSVSLGGVWEIECAGSSIGDYGGLPGSANHNWLMQMLGACQGIEPKTYLTPKVKVPKLNFSPGFGPTKLPIKVVYPTLREIDASYGGRLGGGTLFFPEKYWTGANWPRYLLHQGRSKRQGVICHTKHILALHKPGPTPPPGFKHEGWIYIGSHNFTPSAWGKLSHNAPGPPKLAMGNYECGVIMRIDGTSEADLEKKANALITYQRPLEPYEKKDRPWMQFVDG